MILLKKLTYETPKVIKSEVSIEKKTGLPGKFKVPKLVFPKEVLNANTRRINV
jgi:hypothetical protein